MTESVKVAVEETNLSGIIFDDENIIVSNSKQYEEISLWKQEKGSYQPLPKVYWVKIVGNAGQDDFGLLVKDHSLIISEKALSILKPLGLEWADIYEYEQTK